LLRKQALKARFNRATPSNWRLELNCAFSGGVCEWLHPGALPEARQDRRAFGAKAYRSRLQRAADGCGDGPERRNELGENFRREGLVPIALRHLGRIVHFNH
jgi:hypothetical protein